MKVFRKDSAFLIEDVNGILTPCSTMRETMHVLHRIYEVPVLDLEEGLLDLVSNDYDVAEFGNINGAYLFSGKTII